MGDLIILPFLYGSGALLARDAVRSWGKGYPSLLCLGAAYGIFEEGLVCKSFFDPNWPDLGGLGVFGRALGTNWVWVVWLTLYHMLVSIALPIMLVEIIFPSRRKQPWLSRSWQVVLWGMLAFEATLVAYLITRQQHFFPAAPQYLLTWVVAGFLIWLAPHLPDRVNLMTGLPAGRPFWLWVTSFFWLLLSFIAFTGLAKTGIPPLGVIVVGLALTVLAGLAVLRLSGNLVTWNDRGRFLLAAGVLTVFILFAPIRERDPHQRKDQRGSTAFAALAVGLLLWQGRRVWVRTGSSLRP